MFDNKTIQAVRQFAKKAPALICFDNLAEAKRVAEEKDLALCIVCNPREGHWYVECYLENGNYLEAVAKIFKDYEDAGAYRPGDDFFDEEWDKLMSADIRDFRNMECLRKYVNMRYKVSLVVANLKDDEILIDLDDYYYIVISEQHTYFETNNGKFYLAAISKEPNP